MSQDQNLQDAPNPIPGPDDDAQRKSVLRTSAPAIIGSEILGSVIGAPRAEDAYAAADELLMAYDIEKHVDAILANEQQNQVQFTEIASGVYLDLASITAVQAVFTQNYRDPAGVNVHYCVGHSRFASTPTQTLFIPTPSDDLDSTASDSDDYLDKLKIATYALAKSIVDKIQEHRGKDLQQQRDRLRARLTREMHRERNAPQSAGLYAAAAFAPRIPGMPNPHATVVGDMSAPDTTPEP